MVFEGTLHVQIWRLKYEMKSRVGQKKEAENAINRAQIHKQTCYHSDVILWDFGRKYMFFGLCFCMGVNQNYASLKFASSLVEVGGFCCLVWCIFHHFFHGIDTEQVVGVGEHVHKPIPISLPVRPESDKCVLLSLSSAGGAAGMMSSSISDDTPY